MRFAWLTVALAGCFSPSPQPGAPCSDLGTCPSSLTCVAGTCEREDTTPPDGASADAAPPTDTPLDGPHAYIDPSNGVEYAPALTLLANVTFGNGVVTINTDTGAISGAFTRASGQGTKDDIRFEQDSFAGTPLGVFWVKSLIVGNASTVRFVGTRAAVIVAATTIDVDGVVDLSAGCYGSDRSCPGPGGGAGANPTTPSAGGCGPGAPGTNDLDSGDAGGGGGGAGTAGGFGGQGTDAPPAVGGAACVSDKLVPLRGGGGGGHGGLTTGNLATNRGGGGGGALQLTANLSINIGGRILANGAGGEGGVNAGQNGGGNGGGAGGGILLEAREVHLAASGVLTANGGGGGSGASTAVTNAGANGRSDGSVASGGAMTSSGGAGGSGGALVSVAANGSTGLNGGGGGGAFGVIVIHTLVPSSTAGTISPPPKQGDIDLD